MNALVLMMALRLTGAAPVPLRLGVEPLGAEGGSNSSLGAPPPAVAPPGRLSGSAGGGQRFRRPKVSVPPHDETIRYEIRYGILGSIGSLRVSSGALAARAGGAPVVRLRGAGKGSVLGLGSMESQLDAEFDAGLGGSRRWTSARGDAGAQTVDTGSWDRGGQAHLLRRKPGKPDEVYNFKAPLQTSDPLGLVWRLRVAPPPLGSSETVQVVDGLAMWRVRITTVATSDPVPDVNPHTRALRLEGEIAPFYYDGRPDPDRKTRHFTMWLDGHPGHLPLRAQIPLGPADLVMRLVDAQ